MKVIEFNDFQSLEPEWALLLNKNSANENVFLTWDWLSTWWRHFSDQRKPLLLAIEDDNEIVGLAPLMISQHKLIKGLNVNKLEFIGTPHTDYHGFIFSKKEKECLTLILNYLDAEVADWNWIDLTDIPGNTITYDLMNKLVPSFRSKLTMQQKIQDICPYIPLSGSMDSVYEGFNSRMKRNLKRSSRKIKRDHKIKFLNYRDLGFSVEEAMSIFFKLHRKRWGENSTLGSSGVEGEKFRAFHVDVAKRFSKNEWLGLYFLSVDDEPVSVIYGFEYMQKMYSYLGGFDPNYYHYSVGNLTLKLLLEQLCNRHFKEYDMLRGSEDYKHQWTNKYRQNFRVKLTRTDFFSKFSDLVTRIHISSFAHLPLH